MKQDSKNIASKIIIAYILLAFVALVSVVYVYDIVKQFANQAPEERMIQKKNFHITQTFSLLYASEAQGQIIGMTLQDYNRYNKTLNQAEAQIDSLQFMLSDSLQILKIDSIKRLITRKRYNTKQLIKSSKEASTEQLYKKNIEQLIAVQDTLDQKPPIQENNIKQRVETIQDTLVVKKKSKGFFKRLASAFNPSEADSTTVVNITQQIHNDTILQTFNPSDTIIRLLQDIQTNVAYERKVLDFSLMQKANNLRYNNSLINQKINQLLREIEQEAVDTSIQRTEENQLLFNRFIDQLTKIGILALLIALFSLFIIIKDLVRSNYYKKQLMQSKLQTETLMAHREQLMLTISHDIRTPLSSIMGYVELIQNLNPQPREQYYLSNMQSSAAHILSLANDLLDYHRLEANKMEINSITFDLDKLISEIVVSFEPLAKTKRLEIKQERNGLDQPLLCIGDSIKIRQIVGNLLSNAIKFSQQGVITLATSLNTEHTGEHTISFAVTDNGPGISPADQEKIFSEFAQLSSESKSQGFGLGLTITRKLVALLGGELTLKSYINEGSCFNVQLPIAFSTQQKQETDCTPIAANTMQRPISCLLVDDDAIQLKMVETILTQQGMHIVSCIESAKAYARLMQQPFDLVITDMQMPHVDGEALLQTIRSSNNNNINNIPVIALSGNVAQPKSHYIAIGFTAFLNKPFASNELIQLIHDTIAAVEKPIHYDFDTLTAFAAGDIEASMEILKTILEETVHNIAQLSTYRSNHAKPEVAALAHKLQPILLMIGAKASAEKLQQIQHEELPTAVWQTRIDEVVTEMQAIASQLKAKIGE